MRGSFDFLKGSRIKLERVTKTEITCVVVSLSFLFLTEKFLTYKKNFIPKTAHNLHLSATKFWR